MNYKFVNNATVQNQTFYPRDVSGDVPSTLAPGDFTWRYMRSDQSTWTTVTPQAGTLGSNATSGGIVWNGFDGYQCSCPTGMSGGGTWVAVEISTPSTEVLAFTIEIVTISPYAASVPANVTQWNGTNIAGVDTAGYPKVTVKNGTGAGELSISSGVVAAAMKQIISTTLTETSAGYLAAAFKKLLDVATPVLTAASVNQTGDAYAGVATLLTRIASALTITGGKVDINDKTGFALTAADKQAIWDILVAAQTTNGSLGKLLKDYLDAAVSSRSTYAGGDTSGVTTLLGRIASALTITAGKVDVNDKTGFALTSDYDAAKTAAQAGDEMTLAGGSIILTPIQSNTPINRVNRSAIELYVEGPDSLAYGIVDAAGYSVDMTGKTLAYTVRRKNDKELLFEKTGGDIVISTSTVTVSIDRADVPDGTEETEYEAALREVGGALDGKVWARSKVDVVYAATTQP